MSQEMQAILSATVQMLSGERPAVRLIMGTSYCSGGGPVEGEPWHMEAQALACIQSPHG